MQVGLGPCSLRRAAMQFNFFLLPSSIAKRWTTIRSVPRDHQSHSPLYRDPSMLTAFLVTAALPATPVTVPNTSPRGIKRSRTPEQYGDLPLEGEHDDGMCAAIRSKYFHRRVCAGDR